MIWPSIHNLLGLRICALAWVVLGKHDPLKVELLGGDIRDLRFTKSFVEKLGFDAAWNFLMLTSSSHTVDGTSSVHQLRLVGYPMIFRVLIHSRCAGYSSIKSMNMSFGGRFSGGSGKVFWSFVHIYGVALHPSPSVADYLIEKCWINQLPSDKVIWLPGKNTRCRCISLWQRDMFSSIVLYIECIYIFGSTGVIIRCTCFNLVDHMHAFLFVWSTV